VTEPQRLPRPGKSGLAMTYGVSLRGARFLANASERAPQSRGGARDCELAGGFIPGAEASGADVDFSFLSFYHNRSSLDIR